jgi:hypothetical protein
VTVIFTVGRMTAEYSGNRNTAESLRFLAILLDLPAASSRSLLVPLPSHAGFGNDPHGARLWPYFAYLRRESHLGTDREPVKVVVRHGVVIEVIFLAFDLQDIRLGQTPPRA